MSVQDRYIYTVEKVPVLARCTIVLNHFSYDVFRVHTPKAVHITSKSYCRFLESTTYVDILLEVHVRILHELVFSNRDM